MTDIDLSFNDSQKALVMVEKNNVSEFIELVMESKNLSFPDIMSTEAEPKGIFYQVNYIAVYFVIAGAVAATVIYVVRDVNVQKMKIRLADNKFTTFLIAASLEFGRDVLELMNVSTPEVFYNDYQLINKEQILVFPEAACEALLEEIEKEVVKNCSDIDKGIYYCSVWDRFADRWVSSDEVKK